MPHRRSPFAIALVLVAALALAACGVSKVDVTPAVDELNQTLAPAGVKVVCPQTEIEADTTFMCDVQSLDGGTPTPVEMKVAEEEGERRLDVVDQAAFEQAVLEASGVNEALEDDLPLIDGAE
jgi:hypothetical protein